MSTQSNNDGWSIRERRPDHGNSPRNRAEYGQPFNANTRSQQSLREIPAAKVDRGVDKTREVISQAREKLQPLAEQNPVILDHIPAN